MRNKYLLDGPFVLKDRLTIGRFYASGGEIAEYSDFARPEGGHLSFKAAIIGTALGIKPSGCGRG